MKKVNSARRKLLKNNLTPFRKTILYISVVLTIVAAFFIGYLFGHGNLAYEKSVGVRVVNTKLGQPEDLDFSLFWEVWNKVTKNYPGTIDQDKMLEGAIKGMLVGLGDPYSEYLNSTENQQLLEDLQGSFSGVGIEIANKNNKLTVVSALKDTPAEKAGIRAGDLITSIDNKSTEGMNVNDAVKLIRGEKGTQVILGITRGSAEEKEYRITRDTIKVESVSYEMNGKIAVLKLTQFGSEAEKELNKISNEIIAKNPEGIILDLRDNPGGYLDTCVEVASYFIKKGVIVYEESKTGSPKAYKSNGNGKLANYKLVVLINNGSASASEILAGAIQDYKKGNLIGEKTFGKGSVQVLEDLKDGKSLRLTIAKWMTPNKRYINSTGISPDIEVKLTEEDYNKNRDPQLKRALEEIKK